MEATCTAFAKVRVVVGAPKEPPAKLITHTDQTIQMHASDGLKFWSDGLRSTETQEAPDIPEIVPEQLKSQFLWVVRQDDVAYALEECTFAKGLAGRVIKHTNLTGGAPAYSGGELLFLDETTLVVNGRSGRYGPSSESEMRAVEQAFLESGYNVWSMGYDEEANFALPFIGVTPKWVA